MNRIYLFLSLLLCFNGSVLAQNLGLDRLVPEQKLDVNGSIKIGNTTSGSAGSIRWTGTELQFHDGTSWIVLNANSDDQVFDVIQLNGNDLEISIEADGLPTHSIDLSSYLDNTDEQAFDQVTINGSNQLLLSLEADGQATHVLDLSGYLDNTDEQQFDVVQLTGSNLELSLQNDGVGTHIIDLSGIGTDTDDQALDVAQLSGTNLELSVEDDGVPTEVIDLSSLADNTDDQKLDVANITADQLRLSVESDGQAVHVLDLSPYKDNTDEQALDVGQLSGTNLQLSLENDGQATHSIDLSGFSDNTDDQTFDVINITSDELRLSLEDDGLATNVLNLSPYLDNTDNQGFDLVDINSDNLRLSIENDGVAPYVLDLSPYLDNTDNQALDVVQLSGNTLQLSLENDGVATHTIDLSGYLDNTDDQAFDVIQLVGNTLQLSIEDDGVGTHTIDLSGYLDNTDNQQVETFAILAGNALTLALEDDGIAAQTVSLSGYLDNTDNQMITDLSLIGTTLSVQVESDAGGSQSVDLEALRRLLKDANGDTRVEVEANPNEDQIRFTTDGTEAMTINATQQVGVGLSTGISNQLVVNGSTSDATSTLGLLGGNEQFTFNNGGQIAFGYNGADDYEHFIQTRHNSAGGTTNNSIDFYVSDGTQNNSITSGSTHTMSMNSGNVGVGTLSPNQQLEVSGTARVSTLSGGGTRLVTTDNDGNLVTATSVPSGMGDNLGNHTATTNLNMSNYELDNVGYLDITPGTSRGLRFWSDNQYAIGMGNTSEYHYGPVTGYSIKNHMSNTAARGWTWGVDGVTPVAALSTTGAMQIEKSLKISNNNATGGGIDISDDGGVYDRNDGYGSFAFSAGVDLEDAQDASDHLTINFNDSYPEIFGYVNNSATLVEFRTGMFNNGSTFYSQNQIYARGGVANDYTTLLLNDAVRITGLAGSGNRIVMANASGDLYSIANLNGSGLGDNLGNHTATTTLNMNGQSITNGSQFYLSNWSRHNDNDGYLWSNNGWHIYPRNSSDMNIRTGAGSGGLALMNGSGTRSYMHWTADWQGWLNAGRQWQLRTRNDDGYSPNLYFDEEGNESWTGNPGSDEGKVEYHSNRFYFASGNNSTEIARFRRSGSDVASVSNGGDANFPIFIDWNNNGYSANPAQPGTVSIVAAGRSMIDGLTVIDDGANWHRSYGSTGWYNGSYGGGWQMSDGTWVRSYGNKSVHINRSGYYAFHPYSANHTPIYSISGTNSYWNGQFSGANYSVYAQGYVYASTYGYLSTRDKKKDIHLFDQEDYESAWAFMDDLELNYYKYKDEGTTKGFSDAVQVGFIAEETPGALTTPGKKGVLYGELSIYNTGALKILKQELEAIEEQLRNVKDFGVDVITGSRIRIEFSPEFASAIDGAQPVVTVSAMGGSGSANPSISGIDQTGFYVEKSEDGDVPFSWIAMGKVPEDQLADQYSDRFIHMLETAEHEALTKEHPEEIERLGDEFYEQQEDPSAPWSGGQFPASNALESVEVPVEDSVQGAEPSVTPEPLDPPTSEKEPNPAGVSGGRK